MAIKKKNYELAYADYNTGDFTYEQIAKKYKVSPATVNSWRTRYWSKWDNAETMQETMQTMQNDSSNADVMQNDMQYTTQGQQTKLVAARVEDYIVPIVQKQIKDTNPALIYAEYSKDNLPILEPKQARFVEEYLIDLSKKDAAIRAGYSVVSASDIGCHLYDNKAINAHIQVALAERRKRTGVNVDTTIREMARIAYANPARVVGKDGSLIEGASDDDTAAIASIKVKVTPMKDGSEMIEREIKFHDKNKALEMLGKHQGMFIDKQQIMVAQGTFDTSSMSTAEIEAELKKQIAISNTIDVHTIE